MKIRYDLFCEVCVEKRGINLETLRHVITLAVEIAREGREGRRIGTMFVVSDLEEVLRRSRTLILDPLYGHPDHLNESKTWTRGKPSRSCPSWTVHSWFRRRSRCFRLSIH